MAAETLYDLADPAVRGRYPKSVLSTRALALVSRSVPTDASESDRQQLSQAISARLPQMTLSAEIERRSQAERAAYVAATPTPAQLLATAMQSEYEQLTPEQKFSRQLSAGLASSLPGGRQRPLATETPAPTTAAEQRARTEGAVLPFLAGGTIIAPIGAALGLGQIGASALAAGVTAGAAPGTPKQKVVRGLIYGAGGAATGIATEGAEIALGNRLVATSEAAASRAAAVETKLTAAGLSPAAAGREAARQVGAAAGAARAVRPTVQAAAFGVAAPFAEHVALEPGSAPPTWPEYARSVGLNLMLAGLAEAAQPTAAPAEATRAGVRDIQQNLAPEAPAPTPEVAARAEAVSARVEQALGPRGVVQARVFPWLTQPVRLTVVDRVTGQVYPFRAATLGELVRALPEEPPAIPAGPARGIVTETPLAEQAVASREERPLLERRAVQLRANIARAPNDKQAPRWRARLARLEARLGPSAPAELPGARPAEPAAAPPPKAVVAGGPGAGRVTGTPAAAAAAPAPAETPVPRAVVAAVEPAAEVAPRAPVAKPEGPGRAIVPGYDFRTEGEATTFARAVERSAPGSEPRVVAAPGRRGRFAVEAALGGASAARTAAATPAEGSPGGTRAAERRPEAPLPTMSGAAEQSAQKAQAVLDYWRAKLGGYAETRRGIKARGEARPGGTFKQINERAASKRVRIARAALREAGSGDLTSQRAEEIDKLFARLPKTARPPSPEPRRAEPVATEAAPPVAEAAPAPMRPAVRAEALAAARVLEATLPEEPPAAVPRAEAAAPSAVAPARPAVLEAEHEALLQAAGKATPQAFPGQMRARWRLVATDRLPSAQGFAAQLRGWTEVLQEAKAAGIEAADEHITPERFSRAFDRFTREVAASQEDLRLLKGISANLSAPEGRAVRAEIDAAGRRSALLKRVWQEEKGRLISLAREAAGGKDIAQAMNDLRERIETALGPDVPAASGRPAGADPPSGLGMFPGPLGQWLFDRALRGTPRALERLRAETPRKAREVRITDARGNVKQKFEVVYESDPWTQHAYLRLLARLKVAGGRVILPVEGKMRFYRMQSEEAMWEGLGQKVIQGSLSPSEQRYFAPWHDGELQLTAALEGEPHKIPPQHQGAIAKVRAIYDELHATAVQTALEHGIEPPGYLRKYSPHVTEGAKPDPFLRVATLTLEGEPTPAALGQVVNRYFEHREGDPLYNRQAMLQLHNYVSRWARWMAGTQSGFFRWAERYLTSEALVEPDRAALVKDWIISTKFGTKGDLEGHIDRGLRAGLFERLSGGVTMLTPKAAAHLAGAEVPAGSTQFAYVLPDRPIRFTGTPWQLMGTDRFGGRIYAGKSGGIRAVGAPRLKPWADAIGKAMIGFKLRLEGRHGIPAEHEAEAARYRDELLRLESDPLSMILGIIGRQQLRALIGYNRTAMLANSFNNVLTSIPEYGLAAVARGVARQTRSSAARVRRGIVDLLEDRGHLSASEAAAARAAIPALPDQVRAEAIASLQGEVLRSRQAAREPSRAVAGFGRRALRALAPLRGYQEIEDWTRGVDAVAAVVEGERMGLNPDESASLYRSMRDARLDAWAAIASRITDPKSTAAFAAERAGVTMFHYDPMGQPSWMRGPIGKFFGRLTTFPLSFIQNYEIRPLVSTASVVAAAGRRLVGRTQLPPEQRPARVGEPGAFVPRGRFPAPENPIATWLEKGGAGFEQRQGAMVAARQIMVTGALLGISQATGQNWLVAGIPGYHLAVLGLIRLLWPDKKQAQRWLDYGWRGAVVNYARGAVPFGPTVSLLWNSQELARRAIASGMKEAEGQATVPGKLGAVGAGLAKGLSPSLFEMVRQATLNGLVAVRREAQVHPEVIDRYAPWAWDFLGVRSKYVGLTPAERLEIQLGILPPERMARARRAIHPPPATRERVGVQ